MNDKILEYKKLAFKGGYADDDIADDELSKVNFDDINDLYAKYKEYADLENKHQKLQNSSSDNYSYWSCFALVQTYKFIKEVIQLRIADMTGLNDLTVLKSQKDKADSYDKVIHKIDEKIKGLNDYKPASYKIRIEEFKSLKEE